MINSYLRARLEKIESQVWHYTGPGDAGSRMTQVLYERPLAIIHDSRPPYQEEAAFAVSFRETGTSLLNSLVLKHLPGGAWDPGNFCCEYFFSYSLALSLLTRTSFYREVRASPSRTQAQSGSLCQGAGEQGGDRGEG